MFKTYEAPDFLASNFSDEELNQIWLGNKKWEYTGTNKYIKEYIKMLNDACKASIKEFEKTPKIISND